MPGISSILFDTDIDLQGSELLQARLEQRTGTFATPRDGLVFFDSTVRKIRYCHDSGQALDADRYRYVPQVEAAETVSGLWTFSRGAGVAPFAAAATLPSVGSTATRVTNLNAHYLNGYLHDSAETANTIALRDGSGRIKAVDPSVAADVATKGYVDAVAVGLNILASARAATNAALPAYSRVSNTITATANGSFNSTGIDGITTFAVNDRFVLKNGASSVDNGVYVFTDMGSGATPWAAVRATDADATAELNKAYVAVTEGTVNGGSGWVQTTASPTVNTSNIVWALFTPPAAVVAGNGLVKSGTTLHFCQSAAFTQGGMFYASSTTTVGHTGVLSGVLIGNGTSAPTAASGTLNALPRWGTAGTTLVDSGLVDNGTSVTSSRNLLDTGGKTLGSAASRWTTVNVTQSRTFAGTSAAGALHQSLRTGSTSETDGLRFGIGLAVDESGSNSGSDFRLWSYNDSGGLVSTVLSVKRSTGYISIGGTSSTFPLQIEGAGVSVGGVYHNFLSLIDTARTYNASPNSSIDFRGAYNASGALVQWAAISGGKENATDGATGGFLKFCTTNAAGAPNEAMRITSAYLVGVGSANPQGVLDLGSGTSGRALVWGGLSGSNHYASIGTSYSSAALGILRGLKLDSAVDQYLVSFTGTDAHVGIRIGGASLSDIAFFGEVPTSRSAGAVFDYAANTWWTMRASDGALVATGSKTIATTSNGHLTITPNGTGKVLVSGLGNSKVVTTDGSGFLTGTTAIGATNGGTGASAVATGDLLYGSATDTWSRLTIGAAGTVLRSTGTNVAWSAVTLTTDVGGILPIANGGTNASSFTSGSVLFFDGTRFQQNNAKFFWDNTGAAEKLKLQATVELQGSQSITTTSNGNLTLAPNGTGKVLVSGLGNSKVVTTDGSGYLTGTTALGATNGGTGASTVALGDLLYGSSSNVWSKLAVGSNNTVLRVSGGLPAWGPVVLTTDVSGVLAMTNGGTGASAFTAGSIPFSNGTILTQNNAKFAWDDSSGLEKLKLQATVELQGSQSITTTSNGNITLTPHGTGLVKVTSLGSSKIVTTDASGFFSSTSLPGSSTPARKMSATIGNGSATSFAVTHNGGTQAVGVFVWDTLSPFKKIECQWVNTDSNTVTCSFNTAPATNRYLVVVIF